MTRSTRRNLGLLGAAVLGSSLAACQAPDGVVPEEEEVSVDDGKYEAWNYANNPAYVDSTFVLDVTTFKAEARTKTPPIPGDYWGTYKDSINYRWDGEELSPAEKIEKALNKPGFAKRVTDEFGIYSGTRKACKESSECSDLKDGSQCVTPRGATSTNPEEKLGRCIPSWWGICHGWAPYAISEPAAVNPVVENGVTFYPGDLEALMSFAYSRSLPTKFLSERCNAKGEDLKTDPQGRILDDQGTNPSGSKCRDANPATVIVTLANLIGERGVGLVEDRTYDLEVWNQPVRGYKITNAVGGKIPELTKDEAVAKLGLNRTFKPLLAETEVKKGEEKAGDWTATTAGSVLIKMSGSGDGDLYVKKGDAPTDAAYDCRPYSGNSDESCELAVAAGDKLFWKVKGYADTSKVAINVGAQDGPASYAYNTAAKRFFYVELDIEYITESRPARMSHVPNVDDYTRTDSYQAVLEADDKGNLLGGEWVGDSLRAHPDFLWWPAGKPAGTPAGLTYAEVKRLNDKAAAVAPTPAPVGEVKQLLTNASTKWTSLYPTVGAPGGATIELKLSGTGNADLTVKLGRKPTATVFDCRSAGPTSDETCTIKVPPQGGTYTVRVRPSTWGQEAKVSLTATITPAQ